MLSIGQVFESQRTLSQADFNAFAQLSGDDNPIHVDPGYAAKTHFGGTVSHGMLLYSTLSGALAEHLPGSRQLAHEMMFPSGTHAGETYTIRFEVEEVDPARGEAVLAVRLIRPNGELGLDGRTRIALEEQA